MVNPANDPSLLYPGLETSIYSTVIIDAQQPDQPLIYVNPAFERLTGYRADEALGRNCHFRQGTDWDQDTQDLFHQIIDTGQPTSAVVHYSRRDGSAFQCQLTCIHSITKAATSPTSQVPNRTRRRSKWPCIMSKGAFIRH